MVAISFINPLDQPTGRNRLLEELKKGFQQQSFAKFWMIVAYAKIGPLRRLESVISARRANGLQIEAIFGVDQHGTSAQALEFALNNFSRVYVTQEPSITFHPKVYAFVGSHFARVFVGSNNLTVGGTETNFEAAINLDLQLPADAAALASFTNSWSEMLPAFCPATRVLDRSALNELMRDGVVVDEKFMRLPSGSASSAVTRGKARRSGLKLKPPSPLPPRKVQKPSVVQGSTTRTSSGSGLPSSLQGTESLAIQIKPHHNGEILLSITAALQNPAFFKWPFNGATTPKKGKNIAYPQLMPDPIVNIAVYGAKPEPLLVMNAYGLNTVYYEERSEIRITASPLVGIVPNYSVMIMKESQSAGADYDITIHTPASPDYAAWVSACNQQMPGGGKTPRKFGWF